MSMTRPPYASEFREQMVELVRSGRSPEELAREFEPSAQSIRNWVSQADRDDGRSHDGLTSAEREELRRLRRENRRLRQEREILAKAAAWFARETGSNPSGSSSSCEPTGPRIPSPRCAVCWGSPPAGTTRGYSDAAEGFKRPCRESPQPCWPRRRRASPAACGRRRPARGGSHRGSAPRVPHRTRAASAGHRPRSRPG